MNGRVEHDAYERVVPAVGVRREPDRRPATGKEDVREHRDRLALGEVLGEPGPALVADQPVRVRLDRHPIAAEPALRLAVAAHDVLLKQQADAVRFNEAS